MSLVSSWQADTTKSVIFHWRGKVVQSGVALSVFQDLEAGVTKPGVLIDFIMCKGNLTLSQDKKWVVPSCVSFNVICLSFWRSEGVQRTVLAPGHKKWKEPVRAGRASPLLLYRENHQKVIRLPCRPTLPLPWPPRSGNTPPR